MNTAINIIYTTKSAQAPYPARVKIQPVKQRKFWNQQVSPGVNSDVRGGGGGIYQNFQRKR